MVCWRGAWVLVLARNRTGTLLTADRKGRGRLKNWGAWKIEGVFTLKPTNGNSWRCPGYENMTDRYIIKISDFFDTMTPTADGSDTDLGSFSSVELSLLSGSTVHPEAAYSRFLGGGSLRIEWRQSYPV
jgi:hypothetical protein